MWLAVGSESFARGSRSKMHGALKGRLCLGVGGTKNADMSPSTILIGTAFVGSVVVAANGFILRRAYLSYCRRGQG